ncbi:polysaccharide export outer membrane protein [Bacteroidia bacterium]|nr:polysaccharide export outer membrane protein [Bacteroidia bacterium]GHV08945.1 polysaccharide export outer membrane protein [Bacteroidia bacterium]
MKLNARIAFLLVLLILCSCKAHKKVIYLQSKKKEPHKELLDLYSPHEEGVVRFKPDDALAITVNILEEQQIASDFNLPLQPSATSENSRTGSIDQGVGRQTFVIQKDGTINFPIIGKIEVVGYTQGELEEVIKELIQEKVKDLDPIVTVRLLNFHITIVGEVVKPDQIEITKDRINILEALALAGDMTIKGDREHVTILREKPGNKTDKIVINISNIDAVSSPDFYLQQNDIVYIPPIKSRTEDADSMKKFSDSMSIFSAIVSVLSLALLIVYYTK